VSVRERGEESSSKYFPNTRRGSGVRRLVREVKIVLKLSPIAGPRELKRGDLENYLLKIQLASPPEGWIISGVEVKTEYQS